ncbi:MAG: 2-succinyl-6-hydroxy-2,4-cyclohexadiene-1-carboxylate synthase [Anaerolineae bacterium]|nr:2-succinyl-6-hydroxy-2,4-cyclohexadiene-1-carboxylate synthase [Anaerolineae bacterium]
MPFAVIRGVQYHYELAGSGPPLVLLHGFTGSAANWQVHAEALASQYRVLTVDLLGHGQTDAPEDPPRYAMSAAAADLAELIDHVAEPPAHLLGYSMGARLALYLAVQFPQKCRSLIMESGSPGLTDEAARRERIQQDDALADRIEQEGIERFVDYWENIPLFTTQKRLGATVRVDLRAQRLRNRPLGLANSLRGMGTGAQPSLWPILPQLHKPILLLAGALDTKFVGIARQMDNLLPDARLVVVPDAGHTVHLEAPAAFQTHVLDFLSRH